MMKELVHFFGDSVLLSRTHSKPGSTNIFTSVTTDWNIVRSLCSIADFRIYMNLKLLHIVQVNCLGGANWTIDCGGEKVINISIYLVYSII